MWGSGVQVCSHACWWAKGAPAEHPCDRGLPPACRDVSISGTLRTLHCRSPIARTCCTQRLVAGLNKNTNEDAFCDDLLEAKQLSTRAVMVS